LLFGRLREAIDATRATRPESHTEFDEKFTGRRVKAHKASAPSLRARIAFLERSLNLANEFFMSNDDTDAELFRVAELILASAPSAERMVEIEKDRDGARRATETALTAAIGAAEALARSGFGSRERGQIVPLKLLAEKTK
jgi:hypothetical protein